MIVNVDWIRLHAKQHFDGIQVSELGRLAERFIVRAARILAPGGKIVWLSPNAVRTRNAAERMGLTVELERPVDLGGFDVTLQVIVKSALALRR